MAIDPASINITTTNAPLGFCCGPQDNRLNNPTIASCFSEHYLLIKTGMALDDYSRQLLHLGNEPKTSDVLSYSP